MNMKSTCSTYDRNIIVHSTDRYPLRSYRLQFMCAAQLTSRLIAWRCDELDRLSPLTFAISTAFDSLW
jgi:hypothetical protein